MANVRFNLRILKIENEQIKAAQNNFSKIIRHCMKLSYLCVEIMKSK